MRILLVYVFSHPSAEDLYAHVAEHLRKRGWTADIRQTVPRRSLLPLAYDALVTHGDARRLWRIATRCLGGRGWSRPRTLKALQDCRVPTMPWARAANRREIEALFDRWGAQRMLLKPSFTCGGEAIVAFERTELERVRWRPRTDIFCPELNEDDGDVYKIETCNGALTLAWRSAAPPLGEQLQNGYMCGVSGAYGERSLITPPEPILQAVTACSRRWAQAGIGYSSFDFMRVRDGGWRAIEANTAHVATRWTIRFSQVAERYAEAVECWLDRRSAANVAGRPFRRLAR